MKIQTPEQISEPGGGPTSLGPSAASRVCQLPIGWIATTDAGTVFIYRGTAEGAAVRPGSHGPTRARQFKQGESHVIIIPTCTPGDDSASHR